MIQIATIGFFLAINKVNAIQLLYTVRPINDRAANNLFFLENYYEHISTHGKADTESRRKPFH